MYREDGNVSGQSHVTHSMANVELEDGNIERAAALFLESLGLVMGTGDVSGIIHYIHLLISICSANGDHAEAVTMLAAASRLQQEADYDLSDDDREHIERAVASARASLEELAFHDYWSRGSVMGPDEVLRRMPIIARGIVGPRVVEPAIDWSAVASLPEIALAPDYQLTSREHDVLRLLSGSRSTQEIATALGISPRTVSTHVANLMAKMGVTSRTAAVARALRDGVIPRET
jgi:DNA-binding CsgD family transcriptional regulator